MQIVKKIGRRNVVLRTIGCSRNERELTKLEIEVELQLSELNRQLHLDFGRTERENTALELLSSSSVRAVGPELILSYIFDCIGFSKLPEELFKDIVLVRLVYPSSKLRTTEYIGS
ncbi:MAG: hypothetical protein IT292_01385 [Deltaproteobacteria bacterium]|nr:hypothetical protein [Deltaproteobacteria bacterium]